MWETVFIGAIGFYVVMLPILFSRWLDFMQNDDSLSSNEKFSSWVLLVIATILWPIVVPISYLELLDARKTFNNY
jgi:nitrate reductase NapE component